MHQRYVVVMILSQPCPLPLPGTGPPVPNLNYHSPSWVPPDPPQSSAAAQLEPEVPPARHWQRLAAHVVYQAGEGPAWLPVGLTNLTDLRTLPTHEQPAATCGAHWASLQRPRKPGKGPTSHSILRFSEPLVGPSTRCASD